MTDRTTAASIESANQIAPLRDVEYYLAMLREHMPDLVERYHVKSLGVFGSYVRGEQTPESDLDVLVEYEKLPSLLGLVNLQLYLTDLLGVEVDLVMKRSLRPRIGRRILSEVVVV